ncbi:MAG TPA: metal-dependent hydrolase [Fibrobacteria bacterium]|nr:metal-dependent hydrolase [Fibrobacteria bacterium]
MPTILGHAFLPLGAAVAADRRYVSRPLAITCLIASMLPDLDSLGYFAGVPYGSAWGHRGATHSLLAVAVVAGTAFVAAPRLKSSRWIAGSAVGLSMASHGILDALTSGGKGVAFLWPFDSTRFFLPWHPIRVSPMGMGIFSGRGVVVVASELLWVGLPALAMALGWWLERRRGRKVDRP